MFIKLKQNVHQRTCVDRLKRFNAFNEQRKSLIVLYLWIRNMRENSVRIFSELSVKDHQFVDGNGLNLYSHFLYELTTQSALPWSHLHTSIQWYTEAQGHIDMWQAEAGNKPTTLWLQTNYLTSHSTPWCPSTIFKAIFPVKQQEDVKNWVNGNSTKKNRKWRASTKSYKTWRWHTPELQGQYYSRELMVKLKVELQSLTPGCIHRWACSSRCGSWWWGWEPSQRFSCCAARSSQSLSRAANKRLDPSLCWENKFLRPLKNKQKNNHKLSKMEQKGTGKF